MRFASHYAIEASSESEFAADLNRRTRRQPRRDSPWFLARRHASHHMNAKGFGPAQLMYSSSNPDAIRGQEQIMIENYGGARRSGGNSGNEINGISSQNPKGEAYRQAARTEFGE
ncbi:hypothetical protein [Luteibacter sp. UNCMF366Tsu5.1]|uniref:hypothetical protein n=1 Tax=Luteibacter sp. UNCMF366Tsu5.1 TaxID=1502758 RepID=UPI0011609129|nr:hypothetical protein [Luteibacter sp. UNCMF366Tsu5.1]